MGQRLDKTIAGGFLIPRQDARKAIKAGRVTVDGAIVTDAAFKYDSGSQVLLDGKPPVYGSYIYIMMNKPAGVISATEDKEDTTVLDLLPENFGKAGLGVAGRLDKDSEGLLILTNDGELNHRITSPRHHAPKRYLAVLDTGAEAADAESFAAGMDLGDFTSKPAVLEIDPRDPKRCFVTISEGKFHQVKRMFVKRGKAVLYLKRLEMAGLELDESLEPGQWRQLFAEEIDGVLGRLGILTKN